MTREAQGRVRASGALHAAEGRIAGLPDFGACDVGREHRPPDVIGSHKMHMAPAIETNNNAKGSLPVWE